MEPETWGLFKRADLNEPESIKKFLAVIDMLKAQNTRTAQRTRLFYDGRKKVATAKIQVNAEDTRVCSNRVRDRRANSWLRKKNSSNTLSDKRN
jgi:hypothetical protein